jgi:hypothetical protein
MTKKNDDDRYLVPNPAGGWNVEKENHQRASAHKPTKAEAEKRGREIVHNTGGELRIQNKHGKFIDSDSGSRRNESKAKDRR